MTNVLRFLFKEMKLIVVLLMVTSFHVFAQQRTTITGTVIDTDGQPIPGVNVVIKGTPTQGTSTDANGAFSLQVAGNNDILVFSYIGYATQEITVGAQRTINVQLAEDTKKIDEVVVIGYGTVRKADLTGSVSSVTTKQFEDEPVRRFEDILQGRSAGVDVTYTSGAVGSTPRIRIRGTSSVNRSNDPLYVVDGIITNTGLEGINPSDIQSMQILKDASATAIYGSRAANGVVLITTKKGSDGKAKITLDLSTGMSQLARKFDLMNAYEYATALNDIWAPGTISDADLQAYKKGTKGIDWYDLMTQTGITQDYKLSVSGGNAKTRYLVSGNLFDQTGISITSRFNRYNFRVNLDTEVAPWFNLTTSLNASEVHFHNQSINWTDLLSYSPTMNMPMTTTTAAGLLVYLKDPYNSIARNPYGERVSNYNDDYRFMMNGNVNMLFKIIDGLTLSVQGGYTYRHSPSYYFTSPHCVEGQVNDMGNTSNFDIYWQNTNNLTYTKKFNDHQITATAVWEMSQLESKNLSVTGQNLANPDIVGYWNYANAATRNGSNSYAAWSVASGIFRAMYNYKSRYMLTATIRADGASRFQGDNKWGYFPSASIAWDAAQEDFFKDQTLFQQLKLRASYGVTGNSDIGAYSTLGMLSSTAYGFGTTTSYTGYWGNSFATPNLKWEKNYQYNIGLDFSILKNRIGGTIEVFRKDAKDLLFQKQIPRYNGGGTFWINQGEVKNTGFEVSLNVIPFMNKDFSWESVLNASFVKNEIVDLAGEKQILVDDNSNYGGASQIHKPGYPISSFYLFHWAGFDDQGRNLYELAKGGTGLTPSGADDHFIGKQGNPKWIWGWNNILRYKNWSANILFNAATGHHRLNFTKWSVAAIHGQYRFLSLRESYFQDWDNVKNKADAKYATQKNTGSQDYGTSDFWLEDASFVKIKNISISYNIPKNVLKYFSAQLSVSAQNLATFTKYTGMDPEVFNAGQGVDRGTFPTSRTYTFGLKATF